jgi:hypothetical protein
MMSLRKTILISVMGLVCILATLAIFLFGRFTQAAIGVWALAFMLLAELVSIGVIWANACLSRLAGQTLLRAGLTGAAVFYLAATLATALFAGKLADHLALFIIFNIIVLAIFGLLCLVLILLARRLVG